MSIVLISGSCGLIGSEASLFFGELGFTVIGIDNDMRSYFFGEEASTSSKNEYLRYRLGGNYLPFNIDIRDSSALEKVFKKYGSDISLVIHTAAQPSHDWAAREPLTDFTVNANGTLNLLELTRRYARKASFIFTSTNKVYGDTPNRLPLIETDSRWEIDPSHEFRNGIPETMSIDSCLHSLFGASKVAADILVQEYGRYFEMPTACFRGGCLTGPNHSGAELHGFLAYLMKCAVSGRQYSVFGYGGKQVRDNIHSYDLIQAFYHFYRAPRSAAVYNIGGGRHSNCSMIEAIKICEQITGRELNWKYVEQNRIGDHIWWISDLSKFKKDYPDWELKYDVSDILLQIFEQNVDVWTEQENTEAQISSHTLGKL